MRLGPKSLHALRQQAIAAVFLAALVACGQNNPQVSEEERAEITQQVEASFAGLVDSVVSGDIERYFSFFDTEKYTSLNEDGTVTHSFKDFRAAYLPQIAAIKEYKSLKFDRVKITVIDRNNAVLVNEYDAEVVLTSGDIITAKGGGTQVWSKSNGAWKLVSVSGAAKSVE